jgi:UDP-2,3-diacylglucosamine hydrolase
MDDWQKLERLKRALSGPGEIVLLGDIFEYWVGARQISEPTYAALVEHLSGLTRSGVPVTFIPGNRDFMIDARFARATGVKLEGRKVRRELGGLQVHLEHGDFIYNKNFKYFAYRRLEGFRMLKEAVNESPEWVLKAIGKSMRKVSKRTTPYWRWTEEELFERARPIFETGNDVFICGHIHQPQKLTRRVDGKTQTLLVLGDWDHDNTYAEFDGRSFLLKQG